MRKYWYIFKAEFMSSIQYIFNFFSRIISYTLMIFIFMNLWKYIYSNPDEIINNYSLNQMIWYVTITELIYSSMNGRKFCKKIITDVKSGNLTYNINKPYNYINYLLFSHLGEILINFIICAFLGVIIGYAFLGSFPNLNIFKIFAVLICIILALIINTLLTIFVGLFSFIIEDSLPFYWLYSKIMLLLGTIFPIEFFPKIIQKILNYSPIFVNSYGPAKLFVEFSFSKFVLIILIQIFYITLSYLLCYLLYRKGVKRLNVNGG